MTPILNGFLLESKIWEDALRNSVCTVQQQPTHYYFALNLLLSSSLPAWLCQLPRPRGSKLQTSKLFPNCLKDIIIDDSYHATIINTQMCCGPRKKTCYLPYLSRFELHHLNIDIVLHCIIISQIYTFHEGAFFNYVDKTRQVVQKCRHFINS